MAVTIAKDCEVIRALPEAANECSLDTKGYFLIRVKRETGEIEAGFCRKGNVVEKIIIGNSPEAICYTILRKGLVSSQEHAAYLAKELEKAFIALKAGIPYVQDDNLVFKSKEL